MNNMNTMPDYEHIAKMIAKKAVEAIEADEDVKDKER